MPFTAADALLFLTTHASDDLKEEYSEYPNFPIISVSDDAVFGFEALREDPAATLTVDSVNRRITVTYKVGTTTTNTFTQLSNRTSRTFHNQDS
jgi:hypothetical protein